MKKKSHEYPGAFLKWAGGKTQLLPQFERYFPAELKEGRIKTYIEPFVGAGAVFFHIAGNYHIDKACLFDINREICLTYNVLKKTPLKLIDLLEQWRDRYYSLSDSKREKFFYLIRKKFNENRHDVNPRKMSPSLLERVAQVIFLNKTCYNGLYRTNSRGEFNVPFGRYKRPAIVDRGNLLGVARLLKKATIHNSDFEQCERFAGSDSFIYFDPPYRPLNRTSSFTSYSMQPFNDKEQRRLGQFFTRIHQKYGAKCMLSNSNPKNVDVTDTFFDDLYGQFNIHRLNASRMINSNAGRRGKISELLITNY